MGVTLAQNDDGSFTVKTPVGQWRLSPVTKTVTDPETGQIGPAIVDYMAIEGPAEGKRYCADRDEFESAVLTTHLKDSKGYVKWREWAKAKCQAAGIAAPSDEDIGGGTLTTQVRGIKAVCAALNAAGKQDHAFDLAVKWNASPQAAEAVAAEK